MKNNKRRIIRKTLNLTLPIVAVVLFFPSVINLTKTKGQIAYNQIQESKLEDEKANGSTRIQATNYPMYGKTDGGNANWVRINSFREGNINKGRADYGYWKRPAYSASLSRDPAWYDFYRYDDAKGKEVSFKDEHNVELRGLYFNKDSNYWNHSNNIDEIANQVLSEHSAKENAYSIHPSTSWVDTRGQNSNYFFYANLGVGVAEEEWVDPKVQASSEHNKKHGISWLTNYFKLKYSTEYKVAYDDLDGFNSKNNFTFETPTLLDLQLGTPVIQPGVNDVYIEIPYTTGVEGLKGDGSNYNKQDSYVIPVEYWDILFDASGTSFNMSNMEANQDVDNQKFIVTVKNLEQATDYNDWKLSGMSYWNGSKKVSLPDLEFGPLHTNGMADEATLKSWDSSTTKHTADINYVLDLENVANSTYQDDPFAWKVEIDDGHGNVLASEKSDGTTSLETGTLSVNEIDSTPLQAGRTYDWKLKVYGDRYNPNNFTSTDIEVTTKPLDNAEAPDFSTLQTDWRNIGKHSATLDYSFDMNTYDINPALADNENSTVDSVYLTSNNISYTVNSSVSTPNMVDNGDGTKTYSGTIDLTDLDPNITYDLALSVDWKSNSWPDFKTSSNEVPSFDTENWDAPEAPEISLNEKTDSVNPEGFIVQGNFDGTSYDPVNQLPTNIDSINLMYSLKGDESNPIETLTKTFSSDTNSWNGEYEIKNLQPSTEYSVWTEVTYSAKGSSDFDGLKEKSSVINITTDAYEKVQISDFQWTANTSKPSQGQFDIKVTSGHVGDNWYNPVVDENSIIVKDSEGKRLNATYVSNSKTEGTYTYKLKELQGGKTYNDVTVSLNSNEIKTSFTTADLLAPKAPIITEPTVSGITQTSADVKYSFTAQSGSSLDYLPTKVEKVELIDSKTQDVLSTASDTSESGTFKLSGLEIEKEYTVKVRVTYSGGLTEESTELTFNTSDFKPAQAPTINILEENEAGTTQTEIQAHYKITVPNKSGYNPTKITSITAKIDGANEQILDPTTLEGDVTFTGLEGGTTHDISLIVVWDDSVDPISGVTPVERTESISTKAKDDAKEPSIQILKVSNIQQNTADIDYVVSIPQGSPTVDPTVVTRIDVLINDVVQSTVNNPSPVKGEYKGKFEATGLAAETDQTVKINVYYLDESGIEVPTPISKTKDFTTLNKDESKEPAVSIKNTSVSSSWAEFSAEVTLPAHDDNVYDINIVSYSIIKSGIEYSSGDLTSINFEMGKKTSFTFQIDGLAEVKTYSDFSLKLNYEDEKGNVQTPITSDVPKFTTKSIDDVVVTKSVLEEDELSIGLDKQTTSIDEVRILGTNSNGEQTSLDYEITSVIEHSRWTEYTVDLNLDNEYQSLSLEVNGEVQKLNLIDESGNVINSIGSNNNSIAKTTAIVTLVIVLAVTATGTIVYLTKKK